MFNQLTRAFFASLLTATLLVAVGALASASSSSVAASTGYDISFPQCGGTPPTSAGFGIVGVNDGHPFSINPCLSSELRWAETTLSGAPSFYMNTASPGPFYSSSWPSNQPSPEICRGANSPACSYDYGWNAARVSFANAVSAETAIGSTSPTTAARLAHWWLDVETGNTWETIEVRYGSTAASGAIDRAVLHGSIAYFSSIGVSAVGIYSTASQWQTITGGAGATFSSVPVWMPGYATLSVAEAACRAPSFTGGRVAMIQYPSNGLDGDYLCGLVSTPAADVVTVPGSSSFSAQLVVSGNTGAVTYVQTSGLPNLVVSPTGLVTTGRSLSAGTYAAAGTVSDSNGDQGAFSYSLTVGTITQVAPTSSMVKAPGSSSFSAQLVVSGNTGAVTYVQTSGLPNLVVSPTGLVTTAGPLSAGTFHATGTTSDSNGDSGIFLYTLIVGSITQNAPTSNTVLASASASFSAQLTVSRNAGAVTYVQTSGLPNLVVSPTGLITTSSALTAGTYRVTGSTSDSFGDVGVFVFNLTVTTPAAIVVASHPRPTRVIGYAMAGKSELLAIAGSGFYGRPVITSHAGTTVLVTRDSGSLLIVRVTVKPRSPRGTFTFTVTLANGGSGRVKYNQR